MFQEFKGFSGSDIQSYSRDATGKSYVIDESENSKFKDVLDRVWAQTRGRSAVTLSRITHADGSAWHKIYTGWGTEIPDEFVREDTTYRQALSLG